MKIEVKNISKSFGNVVALDNVSIELNSSEVLGLLGDNGAGKSTLIKILSGIHQPDSGSIEKDGKEVYIENEDLQDVSFLEKIKTANLIGNCPCCLCQLSLFHAC